MGAGGLSHWSIRVRYSSNGADVEGSCFVVSRVVIAIYIIFMVLIEQGPWMSVNDYWGWHCSVPGHPCGPSPSVIQLSAASRRWTDICRPVPILGDVRPTGRLTTLATYALQGYLHGIFGGYYQSPRSNHSENLGTAYNYISWHSKPIPWHLDPSRHYPSHS
jgi:hypothetical protein